MMYFLFENEFLWAVFGHCFILSFKLQASIENILLIKAKKSVDVFLMLKKMLLLTVRLSCRLGLSLAFLFVAKYCFIFGSPSISMGSYV